jgi:HEAT repeat protein
VFEVPLQDNDPISINLFRVTLAEAVQRLIGYGNSILYFGKAETGAGRLQLVRVLRRSPKAAQASLRYIGTGGITKSGEDTIESPDEAVRALAENKNVDTRQKAVEVLVASKSELAVQALTAAIEDEAPEVKAAAVEGLASLGARNSLPQIIKCLKDGHPGVRQSAIAAVALLGDAENLKDLRPMGRDKDASVAAAAEIAIKKLSTRHP